MAHACRCFGEIGPSCVSHDLPSPRPSPIRPVLRSPDLIGTEGGWERETIAHDQTRQADLRDTRLKCSLSHRMGEGRGEGASLRIRDYRHCNIETRAALREIQTDL